MMTQSLKRAALAALVLFGTAGTVVAHGYSAGALRIAHPWSRATPNGAKVAGGYLSVTNTGTEPDTLTGASLDAAGRAEVHLMSMEGNVMRMAPVAGGLVIRPGETITLKPGGYHLMFQDLKGALKQGEMAKGSLIFEKAGTVPVEFEVEGIAAKAPSETHEHDH